MARFLKVKFLIILKLNYNRGQFKKNILNFGYFKKLWILHLNNVWNGKCWAFALKSKKMKKVSDLKLEIDDRFNLFLWKEKKQVSMILSKFFNK